MNTKRKIFSIVLTLALMAGLIQPCLRTTVLAADTDNQRTFTFESEAFYKSMKEVLAYVNNLNSVIASDDDSRTLTLDMRKITWIYIKGVDLTNTNSRLILETLFRECTNLSMFGLRNCNLDGFDFSLLNRDSLEWLYLEDVDIKRMPNLTLNNLKILGLTGNDLSAKGACANITEDKFPRLTKLVMDDCELSDISFIGNLGSLTSLSLADNRLTDASVSQLIEWSNSNLSGLTTLNIGKIVHHGMGGSDFINLSSTNRFTDIAGLASLFQHFPGLSSLDLTSLNITSLSEFANIPGTNKISLDLRRNKINDFAGLEKDSRFTLNLAYQDYSVSGDFVEGRESETPELIRRVHDENDVLHGKLEYNNCSISDDGTRLAILPKASSASVRATSGKLSGSTFSLSFKRIPNYSVPKNITACIGDTLADVALPAKFAWENPELVLEAEGLHTYKAVYTPLDLDRYVAVDDIDIPVNVISSVPQPTPTVTPTPLPSTPAPTATPTLMPTSTIAPTATSAPTATVAPTATATPIATATATPAPTMKPVATAAPTATIEPTVPVRPTATATPIATTTATPVPTMKPVVTAAPNATIEPTPTAKPTATAEPTPSAVTPTPHIPIPTLSVQLPVPTASVPPVITPTLKPDESNQSGNQIEERKDLSLLLATGEQEGKRGVRLTWRKWSGCSGYEAYWSYCDGKKNYKKLKTVPSAGKRVSVHKKLKKDRAYKYYVAAYQIKDGRKYYLAKSPVIHVAMNKEPRTNVRSIQLNKKRIVLPINQTFQIRAAATKESRKKKLLAHEETFRYYVDDREVAGVSKKGVIRAKKKGIATVFVIANNGVANKVKVIVK